MKLWNMLAVPLAIGTSAVASAAMAQYGGSAPAPSPPPNVSTRANSSPAATTTGSKLKISSGAMKPIIALQTAVNANDVANIPARLAEAKAAAQTPQDRFFISQLQMKAAFANKDEAAQAAAIQAQIDSGGATAERLAELRLALGNTRLKAKDFAGALALLQPLTVSDPNNTDAMLLTAEALYGVNRTAEAVPLLQKVIAAQKAQGKAVDENIYRRALAFAYKAKSPVTNQLALDWVRAYPSPATWRDTVRLYAETSGLSGIDLIDVYRLERAAGALQGETEFYRYAATAAEHGLPGEAKGVLEEGFASKAIDRTRPMFRDTYANVSRRVTTDRASLAASERTALAGSAAKGVMSTADAYLGYGDYAKAASLYRAALGKSGADTGLANLRLGIALARSGDKAGATTAFNAVSGNRAGLAKLWLAWIAARA